MSGGRWIVVGDGDGVGADLVSALGALGHAAILVADSGFDTARTRTLLSTAFDGLQPTGVVHLGSLQVQDELNVDAIESALIHGCDSVLSMVQALAAAGYREPPRLWLVTRGAQAVHGKQVSVAQSPLLGLGRVIAMEHSDLRCARRDLDPASPDADVDTLVRELLADEVEEEVAWRDGMRYIARLDRRRLNKAERRERIEIASDRPFRLELDRPGAFVDLVLRATERRAPGPNEVEIQVQASGVSSRDVASVLAGSLGEPMLFGSECAGVVVGIGEAVTDYRLGQDVLALAPSSAASHVLVDKRMVAPRPPTLSAVQAAALAGAFMTAWYGLADIARLRAGERILIHPVSGGVGQAAVQVARRLGAQVFATAGTAEQRAWLSEQGITSVLDCRSSDFLEQLLAATNGEGVDVVMVSHSELAIEVDFSTQLPDARLIETGQSNRRNDKLVGSRRPRKCDAYFQVDLMGLAKRRPAKVSALLHQIVESFATGLLTPLPVESLPISRAAEALGRIAQDPNHSPLALTTEDSNLAMRVSLDATPPICRNGTYLISGGLGGLGLSVARWLSQQGAGHLLLVGRSGAATPTQEEAIASISALGTRVTVAKVDIANRQQVQELLQTVADSAMPLRGVIHAAGILDDGLLTKQNPARFRSVMAPKIQGALHLHDLTRELSVDFFVMYSSVAGLIGSPGQGNYAAANAFLDALAHQRKAQGLPALSIDWGPFSDVGLAAAQEIRGGRLAAQGMRSLEPDEGLLALAKLIESDRAQTGVVSLDVRQWLQCHPTAASSTMLSRLIDARRGGSDIPMGDRTFMDRLAAAKPDEKVRLLEGLVAKEVSQVLRIPAGKVALDVPLTSLGMDSLTGLELRNRIESSLGAAVSATALWTYPTIEQLSRFLSDGPSKDLLSGAPGYARELGLLTQSDSISEAEALRLIDEEFEVLQ